jgi:protein tyrosine phosphatase (PTP) superfamily phosphohydrolase (DUF442 family)
MTNNSSRSRERSGGPAFGGPPATPPRHDHQWVTDRLAVGSAVVKPEHMLALAAGGITHVIDCRLETEGAELYAGTSVRRLHCGTADNGEAKPVTWFEEGITFALAALARPRTRVLVHCIAGVSRSPSMTYAILRALGQSSEDAVEMIKKARIIARVTYKEDADRALHILALRARARARSSS